MTGRAVSIQIKHEELNALFYLWEPHPYFTYDDKRIKFWDYLKTDLPKDSEKVCLASESFGQHLSSRTLCCIVFRLKLSNDSRYPLHHSFAHSHSIPSSSNGKDPTEKYSHGLVK